MRAVAAVVLMVLLAACGATGGAAGQRPGAQPSGAAAAVSNGGAVPTNAPPASASAVPSLPSAVSGIPAFTYAVPAGWRLVQQDTNQADLAAGASAASAERIRLTLDPAQEQTAGLATTAVDRHTAYIVRDGPSDDHSTYTRVWLIADGGGYYELLCSGYSGYDEPRLLSGCDAFTRSVRFTG